MNKKLILTFLIIIMTAISIACSATTSAKGDQITEFIKVGSVKINGINCSVVVDPETNAEYLTNNGRTGALSPRLNSDGTPMLYTGELPNTEFIKVGSVKINGINYSVVVDPETNAEYLTNNGRTGALSPRLNSDGTPMIYTGELPNE